MPRTISDIRTSALPDQADPLTGYWFGVTSTVGDRVIGTLPDQRTIPRSPTARSLDDDS